MASPWSGYGPSAPPATQLNSETANSKKKPQPRQLLSCTKCRERKVKCDRTKPCSACCARGHPKECQFIVGEGNDYSPIQQSYEIRKLRQENQKLRERLRDARLAHSEDEDEDDGSPDRYASKSTSRAIAARQRRFRTGERVDNMYFGTPGLANIVADFANLQVGSHSLTHTVPKGQDIFPAQESMYPFPMIQTGDNTVAALTKLLPPREELFQYLDLFQQRAQSCSFPHIPDEITSKEVERFLGDLEGNATKAPDMLGLLFATLATGMQMGVHDRSGGQWVAGAMRASHQRSECYLAASMQALRWGSFMSQPTLLGIQALIMIGPYLTNSGRFLDAWTLFGTTIRIAHSIGLHRNPKFLDPVPPLRECTIRQTLWWWMLHMDQQYSVTLGRPLGISGTGDCPPPETLTTDQTILRLGEFVNYFTLLARQILSAEGMTNVATIDEFTDKLMSLWDTMPETLQFNESWTRLDTILPDWPLDVMAATLFAKVQSFIILLNRQRVERTQNSAASNSPPTFPRSTTGTSGTTYSTAGGSDNLLHPAPIRGRALVINSSIHLLQTFLFFYHRNPAVLVCWTLGQQAFNAAMILILDAWETSNEQNEWLVNQAYAVFDEMQRNDVHKLAELAVKRISAGLAQLGHRRQERQNVVAAATISRRPSQQQAQPFLSSFSAHPSLTIDTANMLDLSGDTVMGNTGMFLLEDPGLQAYVPQSFAPFNFNLPSSAAGSAHPSNPSGPPTPTFTATTAAGYSPPPPTIPVSNVTVAPFPVMSPPFVPAMVPTTASPYAVGLQPRMMPANSQQRRFQHQQAQHAGFTPLNDPQQQFVQQMQQQQQPMRATEQPRQAAGVPYDGAVPRTSRNGHRLDRPPRSQSRRQR